MATITHVVKLDAATIQGGYYIFEAVFVTRSI